jgi:predicted transcriptional regulator
MDTKHPTSIRLSADEKRLLAALASTLGISQSAVLALAIRALAQHHGVR